PLFSHGLLAASTAFSCCSHVHRRDLHSFPTRRSSDLGTHPETWSYYWRGRPPRSTVMSCRQLLFGRRIRLCATVATGDLSMGRADRKEHTSELQSRFDLVCRLLLEKKKQKTHRAARQL